MSIENINFDKCKGTECGICVDSCPQEVLRFDTDGILSIAYPDDCSSCFWCAMDCPSNAIHIAAVDSLPWLSSLYK